MEPWTVAFAQVALGIAVRSITSAMDLLERVHAGLPAPPDLAERQEGRKRNGHPRHNRARSQRQSPARRRSAATLGGDHLELAQEAGKAVAHCRLAFMEL
jgi:hypothetical protein